MLRPPRSDFWRVGVLPVPIEALSPAELCKRREQVRWLPEPGPWRFLADPFALKRGDALHVFVESFDYRNKHGVIERHELDATTLGWRGWRTVLERPFHLSYPYVFEHEGETFMVPESHQAGEIALYRAVGSLDVWQRECALLSLPGAEASLIRHQDRWWMFFTLVGPGARDQRELHVAHADTLTGPWLLHPSNPVLSTRSGARPGGTPYVNAQGTLVLPVQDCSEGYGGALRLLEFDVLDGLQAVTRHGSARYTGELLDVSHDAGFHTLSACGGYTLFDVKRVDRSRQRQWLDLRRRMARLTGRRRLPAAAAPEPAQRQA